MRQLSILVSVIVVILAGALGGGQGVPGTAAQEGTPTMDTAAPIAGATVEILDIGEPAMVPGQVLAFVRVTFEPGGYFAAHGHPGAQIWYIDTGALQTTMLEGSARLTRAPVGGTPGPVESLPSGGEATMAEGDTLFFDHDVVHTVRNETDETAVLLISTILDAAQDPVIFHHEHDATPVP